MVLSFVGSTSRRKKNQPIGATVNQLQYALMFDKLEGPGEEGTYDRRHPIEEIVMQKVVEKVCSSDSYIGIYHNFNSYVPHARSQDINQNTRQSFIILKAHSPASAHNTQKQ